VADPGPFFVRADVVVLSSTSEGFGNVLVEAMEHGTPVVSTDCPFGPSEILAGGTFGPLVIPGDSEGLANAIQETWQKPIDKELLQRRAAEFSVERAVDRYLSLLNPKGPREHAHRELTRPNFFA
jgi:glycosyltransferase involved in cell wall biosynthesis